MNRISFMALLMVASCSAASHAALPTLSENFGSPTLNSQLYITSTGSAYSAGPLTPGATWQLSKQAGTTTGEIAIHTGFEVVGNFTADLIVDSTNLGTGEVGIRIGDAGVYPWSEIFFQGAQGPGEVTNKDYGSPGGYGVAGIVTDKSIKIEMARTGNTLDFYANGLHFAQAPGYGFNGAAEYLTVFLRPDTGAGGYNPFIGQPDAHLAVLDQLTIVASGFVVPEPSIITLFASALAIGCARRRRTRGTVG